MDGGPTCIFWANLTLFSLQARDDNWRSSRVHELLAGLHARSVRPRPGRLSTLK
jgi:hypothetical protein